MIWSNKFHAIREGAPSVVEHFPAWVEPAAFFDVFDFLNSADSLSARVVARVVVKVAHDDNALVGVDSQTRVGDVLAEISGSHAEVTARGFTAQA